MFPESPAPENCSRCADAGVLGPVPGVMGVLQVSVLYVLACTHICVCVQACLYAYVLGVLGPVSGVM